MVGGHGEGALEPPPRPYSAQGDRCVHITQKRRVLGALGAQSVKRVPSAQVRASGSWGRAPCGEFAPPPASPPPTPLLRSLCLSCPLLDKTRGIQPMPKGGQTELESDTWDAAAQGWGGG